MIPAERLRIEEAIRLRRASRQRLFDAEFVGIVARLVDLHRTAELVVTLYAESNR